MSALETLPARLRELLGHGRWAFDDGDAKPSDLAAAEPKLIFSVPRAGFIDALERLDHFQSIPSVQQIVMLAPTKAKARVFTRDGANWRAETIGPDAALDLTALNCALPLGDLYNGSELAQAS